MTVAMFVHASEFPDSTNASKPYLCMVPAALCELAHQRLSLGLPKKGVQHHHMRMCQPDP